MGASPKSTLKAGGPCGGRLPYYGWLVLVVCMLCKCAKLQGQNNVMTYTVPHLLEDLGLSHSELGVLYSIGTISAGMVQPLLGGLVDRFGARVCIPMSELGLCATLLLFSLMQRAKQHVLYAEVVLSFFFVRAISMGTSETYPNACIQQWFVRWRGRAMACMSLAQQVATAVAAPVVSSMVEGAGWRSAIRLGSATNLALVPISLLLLRNHPEDCGLWPDGDQHPPKAAAGEELDGDPKERGSDATLSEPVSPAAEADSEGLPRGSLPLLAWVFTFGLLFGGCEFYLVELVTEAQGPDGPISIANHVLVPMALVSGVTLLCVGDFMDRFGRGRPAVVPIFMTVVSLLTGTTTAMLLCMRTVWMAVLLGASRGLINGIQIGLLQSGIAYIEMGVPRSIIGRMLGVNAKSLLIGTGVGPLAYGLYVDAFGNFRGVLLLSTIPHVLLAIFFACQAARALLASRAARRAALAAHADGRRKRSRYQKVGSWNQPAACAPDAEKGATDAAHGAAGASEKREVQEAQPPVVVGV